MPKKTRKSDSTKPSTELLSENGSYSAPLNIFHLPTFHNRNRSGTPVLLDLSPVVLAHGILEISSCIDYVLTITRDIQRPPRRFKRDSIRILPTRSNETETYSPPWVLGSDCVRITLQQFTRGD